MVYTKVIVKDLKLEYEGLLVVSDLYKLINLWIREKSFDMRDNLDVNVTKPDGTKHIELELEPWRKWTDYHKQRFRIRIYIWDCKNVTVEKSGSKTTMQHAKLTILFDVFMDFGWLGKSAQPLPNFIQILWDKIFLKPWNDKYEDITNEDINHLYQTIKRYLNMPKSSDYTPRYELKS
ncbi:hypothetical protein K9M79_08495 [Candidatus Woesearchaeota archaeon]|nr:hypothetical protein [Candidatus Woesearchaeota archaeon]